jgi:hypothetical protein
LPTRVVSANEFKAKCLSLIDDVEKSGGPLRATPMKSPKDSWAGRLRIVGDIVNTNHWDSFSRKK